MPVLRRRARTDNKAINGLFIHSSPPRVLQLNSAFIKQLIRSGDVEKMELAVLEGQGKKLVGEYSADYKTRTFLRSIPGLMSKISLLHDSVNSDRLEELQAVLDEEPEKKKRLVMAKDETGVGLLHKAVYYDLKSIYKWLIDKFPQMVNMRDSEGRTAYHYSLMCKDPGAVQKLLIHAGADPSALDNHQRSAKYYADHRDELELPSGPKSAASSRKSTAGREGLSIKKSNIRIWIHQRNLTNLQQVVWEGHGSKLLVEHSNNPKIKKFLEAVPHIMGMIKEIHCDVQEGDLDSLKNHVTSPIPPIVLSGKDMNGLTPLHKAAGLDKEEIAEFILAEYPSCINSRDNDGRTPLHYASLLKDDGKMTAFLIDQGADESALDNKQKTAAYYKTRNSELDSKLLHVVPECPRSAKESFAANFDWSMISASSLVNGVSKSAGKHLQDDLENKNEAEDGQAQKNGDHEEANLTTDDDDGTEGNEGTKGEPNGIESKEEEEASEPRRGAENEEEIVDTNDDAEIEMTGTSAGNRVAENVELEENTTENGTEEKDNNNNNEAEEDKEPQEAKLNGKHQPMNEEEEKVQSPSKTRPNSRIESVTRPNSKTESVTRPNSRIESVTRPNSKSESVTRPNSRIESVTRPNSKSESVTRPNSKSESVTRPNSRIESVTRPNSRIESVTRPNSQTALIADESRPSSNTSERADKSRPTSAVSEKSRPSSRRAKSAGRPNSKTGAIPIEDGEGVIEGVVHGDEVERMDNEGIDENGAGGSEGEIKALVDAGNMEQLAALVLNGDGEKLVGQTSDNPELQAFLENVPVYMSKIQKIHEAARSGSLRDLQAALDRRKFAIAKDSISARGASPLHVAVIFGNTSIVRYLAGRFPETVQVTNDDGRTPLHYAAVLRDNGHYYNLLVHLGADMRLEDKFGHNPEYYRKNQEDCSHRKLLKEFGVEEKEAEEVLTDKDNNLTADNGQVEMPFFATEEGRYLASSLGDPLIKGLTEVANKRPEDPIAYLAQYLYNFANNGNNVRSRGKTQESSQQIVTGGPTNVDDNKSVPASIDVVTIEPDETNEESAFSNTSRDEHGQSMLHFASSRSHGRNALFQLLQETDINVAYRDELYRTARDISIQANLPENTEEIDRYVLHIATKGDTDKLVELLLDGYDHITDIVDSDGIPIIEAVSKAEQPDTVSFLQSILAFEEKRERVHHAIRQGSVNDVTALLADENDTGSGKLLAIGKNSSGRSTLHIAVLCQQEEIIDYLANTFPDTLKLGDNLERTALHYAMGVDKMETISRVLIKAGAKRVTKDLKGRQPTYYFLNKSDVQRLQEEEETF